MKKLLSVLFVIVALVGCMALSVSAAETDVQAVQAYIDAQPEGAFVELPSDITGDLTVNKTLYLQMNGFSINGTVTVTGGATLYGMDSATDDYIVDNAQYGKIAKVVGSYAGVPAGAQSNEDSYLAVADKDGVVSFHRVKLEIYAMSLRVDAATNEPGLYYKSHFRADEVAAASLVSHGVALSVLETPNAGNLDSKCGYSTIKGFEAGPAANLGNNNSTLLCGIMKAGNTDAANKQNLAMTVYGRAYAKTADGQYLFGTPVERSLAQQLTAINGNLSAYSETQVTNVANLYNAFKSALADLNLTNIANAANNQDDGVLKVLVLGNSHSVDATNYLLDVFKTEAPDQDVTVGVLYYSGCPMEYHNVFLNNNQPAYIYFKNSTTDNVTEWDLHKNLGNVSCLYALQDEQWDWIIMQQMSRHAGVDEYYNSDFKAVRDYLMNNVDYTPKLGFHVPWVSPDDYDQFFKNGATYGSSDPNWQPFHETNFGHDGHYFSKLMYNEVTDNIQTYLLDRTDILGQELDMLIPSITAIQYAQDIRGQAQAHLYRDYTHTTDYGRLIAAYLWYAKLMGLDNINGCKIITNLPSVLHHEDSKYPSGTTLSTTDKNDLIASVNWALQNPLTTDDAGYPTVSNPLTQLQLDSLPRKNTSMTVAQMREACLEFMRLTKNAQWTPSEDTYYSPYYKNLAAAYTSVLKGQVYAGLPYNGNGSGNLYRLAEYIDPDTGVVDMTDIIKAPDLFGNNCSTSTSWAWARVINSAQLALTKDMTPANGYLALGGYANNYTEFTAANNTSNICSSVKQTNMYKYYAELAAADGLVSYSSGGDGHAMMVVSMTKKTNFLGIINGSSSTVTVLEQVTDWNGYNKTVENTYTFSYLFSNGYIPFTFAEFTKGDTVESTSCSINLGSSVTSAQLFGATISSNYAISDAYITMKRADGSIAYRGIVRTSVLDFGTAEKVDGEYVFKLPLAGTTGNGFDNPVIHRNDLSKLRGNYSVEISVQLATGERVMVYTGNVSM